MKTKINLRVILLSVAVLTATACKNTKNEKPGQKEMKTEMQHTTQNEQQENAIAMKAEFKDATTANAFQHYMHLKTALVNSDPTAAQNGAEMLSNSVENDNEIKETAKAIATTEDLEKQRELFSTLTAQLEGMLKGALASGELYKQYCPMAFNNTGGYWFSDRKEIRNPYFGDKMLKCGSVKETIK
ncbi:MAG: DUF3347 domain-containing protein [Bacteroidota bacterium]